MKSLLFAIVFAFVLLVLDLRLPLILGDGAVLSVIPLGLSIVSSFGSPFTAMVTSGFLGLAADTASGFSPGPGIAIFATVAWGVTSLRTRSLSRDGLMDRLLICLLTLVSLIMLRTVSLNWFAGESIRLTDVVSEHLATNCLIAAIVCLMLHLLTRLRANDSLFSTNDDGGSLNRGRA